MLPVSPGPLLSRDFVHLTNLVRPRWQRRGARWVIFIAGCLLVGIHAGGTPAPICSDLDPCEPSFVGSTVIGLLLAATAVSLLHAGAAAWTAAVFALFFIPADRLVNPDQPSPAWMYILDVGFVVLCFALARLGRWQPTPQSRAWLDAVTRDQLPLDRRDLPKVGAAWRFVAVGLLFTSLVVTAWSVYAQDRADKQQANARAEVATVIAQPDEFTIRVQLPGEDDVDIPVLSASDHPVGQHLGVLVDEAGLRQPVSEPYDATIWSALAVIVAACAVGCWWRGRDRHAPLDELADAGPVFQVYVRPGFGVAAVYPFDASPGQPAVAAIPCEIGLDPVQTAEADEIDEPDELQPTRRAVLYGVPVVGGRCAVEVDGRLYLATAPVQAASYAPPFTAAGETWLDSADVIATRPQTPLALEERAQIRPADVIVDPNQAHSQERSRVLGLYVAFGLPLLMVKAGILVHLPYLAWLAIVAVVTAATVMYTMSRLGGERLLWNGAGVALIGGGAELIRAPWTAVQLIEHTDREVTLNIGEDTYTIGVPILPIRGWGRSAMELAYALRAARERALAGDIPSTTALPVVPPPRRFPPLVIAIYLLYVPLLAWLMSAW